MCFVGLFIWASGVQREDSFFVAVAAFVWVGFSLCTDFFTGSFNFFWLISNIAVVAMFLMHFFLYVYSLSFHVFLCESVQIFFYLASAFCHDL